MVSLLGHVLRRVATFVTPPVGFLIAQLAAPPLGSLIVRPVKSAEVDGTFLAGITLFAGNHTTLVALAFAKNEVRRGIHISLAVSLSHRLVMSIICGSCEQMSQLLPVADALTRPISGSPLKSPMAGIHDGRCRSRSTRIR
jgi:hypothetical protein